MMHEGMILLHIWQQQIKSILHQYLILCIQLFALHSSVEGEDRDRSSFCPSEAQFFKTRAGKCSYKWKIMPI